MRMDKTTECNYITPCGWCEKWDKKCDLKTGEVNIELKLKELELEKAKQELEKAKQRTFNPNDGTCYY